MSVKGIELVSEGITYSEQMQREFEFVDEHISELGNGMSKEMAKSSGLQLVDNIKNVEFKDAAGVSDLVFGRRMTTNLVTILEKIAHGDALKLIVEVNYPVDRYIRKSQEKITSMQSEIQMQEVELDSYHEPPPANAEYYNVLGMLEWDKEQARKASKSSSTAEVASTEDMAEAKPDKIEKESSRSSSPSQRADEKGMTKAKFLAQYSMMYITDTQEYRVRQSLRLAFSAKKKKVEEEANRAVVIVAILDGIRSAMNTIVSKLKAALTSGHVSVRTKLSAMVTISKTGELIVNPFENNNLSGMYHILKSEYHTATLVQFNRDFSDLLRCPFTAEELLKEPLRAVNQVDKKIADWMLMAYGKFMTVDIFMVNILLMYLPQSSFKDRCVVSVTEFIQANESDSKFTFGIGSDSGVNSMLIYQHLVEFMKVHHNSVGFLGVAGSHKGNNSGSNTQSNRNARYNHQATGLEHAAAVGETYLTAIPREKGVLVKDIDSGTQYLYTATISLCPICHGAQKAPGDVYKAHLGSNHQYRCVRTSCYKCNYFGHRAGNCCQHASTHQPKSN